MQKIQLKKLLITFLTAVSLAFSLSICASADVQIEGLSVVDSIISAKVSQEAANANFYAASYNEGLLSDAFFVSIDENGYVSLPIGEASEYRLYIWDKDSLAPLSATYVLKEGVAYQDGSSVPVPPYSEGYVFDQNGNVMIVSEITENSITGFVKGVETTYNLTNTVIASGLSDNLSDIVPGSVVLLGTNSAGDCGAIELLATVGLPVTEDTFTSHFGVYDPSDSSTRFKNVVTEMYSKTGTKIVTRNLPDQTKTTYYFENDSTPCYRVGIAIENDIPIITTSTKKIGDYPSIFEDTSKYHNYLYLRYDTSKSKTVTIKGEEVLINGLVTECVFYCVPKDLNAGGSDDEYSPIFGLTKKIIIE